MWKYIMINYNDILNMKPYSMNTQEKNGFLLNILKELTQHHYDNCNEYRRILDAIDFRFESLNRVSDFPYIPVRLFKLFELKSILEKEIVKTMTSSGTTGQKVSKIFIDRQTSKNQTKALTKIVSTYIGNKRSPMIIIDTPSVLRDRNMFSARGAGILGFSIFGKDRIYALNEKMELDTEAIEGFLDKYKGETIFLFGFTFIIWLHFYQELLKKNHNIDLSNGVLFHGGGWKKLLHQSVSREAFKQKLQEATGIMNVHDYYGMVEQTGTIHIECEQGHLHSSIFSDIIIRKPFDFTVVENGKKGMLQVLSILPHSYPGHSILTEDEGVIVGEDDCPCGRSGKYFRILGRIKNAEVRGCSNTYEQSAK